MLLSPIQNTGVFLGGQWLQKRPRITQGFGENPAMYDQFGMLGHNGVDYGVPVGTEVFAPFEGDVYQVGDEKGTGYGRYIKLRKDNLEFVLGHLSEVHVYTGQKVYMGDVIGKSGNTGYSTGPHLHVGVRYIEDGRVLNYTNGYKGYVDCLPMFITWKGGFLRTSQ